MTRADILNVINEIIEEEHGVAVSEDNILSDCIIDSFGYAVLFVGLEGQIEEQTGIIVFGKDVLKEINPNNIRVSKLLDMIEEKLCI